MVSVISFCFCFNLFMGYLWTVNWKLLNLQSFCHAFWFLGGESGKGEHEHLFVKLRQSSEIVISLKGHSIVVQNLKLR